MPYRFFLNADLSTAQLNLHDEEAHHLRNVLRLVVGDVVELFNGRGQSRRAIIRGIAKREIQLTASADPVDHAHTAQGTIAAAVPKGDRFKWMIEKLTELNVRRFIPLKTDHSVVHPKPGKLERLRLTAIAACKQSGRNHLPEIAALTDFSAVLATDSVFFLADCVPTQHDAVTEAAVAQTVSSACVLIGPEGGWSDSERALAAAHNTRVISLGTNVLRLETAAIAAAALLSRWQQRRAE